MQVRLLPVVQTQAAAFLTTLVFMDTRGSKRTANGNKPEHTMGMFFLIKMRCWMSLKTLDFKCNIFKVWKSDWVLNKVLETT